MSMNVLMCKETGPTQGIGPEEDTRGLDVHGSNRSRCPVVSGHTGNDPWFSIRMTFGAMLWFVNEFPAHRWRNCRARGMPGSVYST